MRRSRPHRGRERELQALREWGEAREAPSLGSVFKGAPKTTVIQIKIFLCNIKNISIGLPWWRSG